MWRVQLEEVRRKEEADARARRRREQELFDLRAAAAVEAATRGASKDEEGEEDEEAAMFSDPLRQMQVVLGRPPTAGEMKWADSVAGRGVEALIDEWVVRCVHRFG